MDRVYLYGVMVVLMMEILRIIIYKVKDFIHGRTEENIKVNGRTIKWMEKENLGFLHKF